MLPGTCDASGRGDPGGADPTEDTLPSEHARWGAACVQIPCLVMTLLQVNLKMFYLQRSLVLSLEQAGGKRGRRDTAVPRVTGGPWGWSELLAPTSVAAEPPRPLAPPESWCSVSQAVVCVSLG